jgi:hypothetical protein
VIERFCFLVCNHRDKLHVDYSWRRPCRTVSPLTFRSQLRPPPSHMAFATFGTYLPTFMRKLLVSMKSNISWYMTPCSPLKVNWLSLSPAFTLVSCSFYSSTMKTEAICTSETSVEFRRTTRRYNPRYINLYNHRCDNLKSYMLPLYWPEYGDDMFLRNVGLLP